MRSLSFILRARGAARIPLLLLALGPALLHADPGTAPRQKDVLVLTAGVPGGACRLEWPGQFQAIRGLVLRTKVRWGPMYDLYSLNQPPRVLEVRFGRNATEEKDGVTVVSAEGEGPGVTLRTRFVLDAAAGTLTLVAELRRTQGTQPLKHQIVFEIAPESERPGDIAWVLPGPGRFTIVRPFDASEQNVFDQDGQTSFPVFRRLPERWAMLASVADGRGILFHGDAVRHFRGPQRPDPQRIEFYGNDRFLVEGDSLAETIVIEAVPGLGALSRDLSDARDGIGALATRRYVTDDRPLRVRFTGPDQAEAEAELRAGDRPVTRSQGKGDLELPTIDLADGDYVLRKRLRLPGRVWDAGEPVAVVREAFRHVAAETARLRTFAEALDPAAAPEPAAARVRRDLLLFLLDEIAAYRTQHHLAQMDALLADARHAAGLLESAAPAALPPAGEVLYENDLRRETGDFDFFGAGQIEYHPENGLFFGGEGTMNLWSTFTVEGSFLVEFDYLPLDSPRGGTMFQMCGRHPMPNSDTDFMTTASWGAMSHYMFGVSCYHFSFAVKDRDCRLRKTGQGFHILSSVPDPVAGTGRWHRLAFARHGARLLFFADGALVQEYHDQGRRGPVLEGGRIGIRNWSGHRAWFRNLAIKRLKTP